MTEHEQKHSDAQLITGLICLAIIACIAVALATNI
jgi:hypothetical protein